MGVCSGKLPAIDSELAVHVFALCISCMIEVKRCFGKGFGWICALNRWSVQERAQTSFCPTPLQVGIKIIDMRAVCRQIAAFILSRLNS